MKDRITSQIEHLRRILRDRLAVNRAVGFVLITRIWQFLSAPVTIFLIVQFFDERLLGYYYLFISLLASQIFFEMGLNSILSLLASHEWAELEFSSERKVTGQQHAQERLASLVRYGDLWYRLSMFLFILILGVVGFYLIRDPADSTQLWLGPWILAVLLNGVSLAYQPRLAILEGCHQVANVNFVRMIQAIAGTLIVWICIANGAKLWTVAASNGVRLLCEIYIVNKQYRSMFISIGETQPSDQWTWQKEIWPLQWRLALQSVGQYLSGHFFVPVIDQFHGKAAAGRMGMTWSIMNTLQAASLAWTQTRMPEFGSLTAQGKIEEINNRIKHIGAISVGLLSITGILFVAFVWGLEMINPSAANRFLAPWQISLLLFSLFFFHISWHEHVYIRLFKRDPFLIQSIINAILIGSSAWYFGKLYGASGIIISQLCIYALFMFPFSTWLLHRHRESHVMTESKM